MFPNREYQDFFFVFKKPFGNVYFKAYAFLMKTVNRIA